MCLLLDNRKCLESMLQCTFMARWLMEDFSAISWDGIYYLQTMKPELQCPIICPQFGRNRTWMVSPMEEGCTDCI